MICSVNSPDIYNVGLEKMQTFTQTLYYDPNWTLIWKINLKELVGVFYFGNRDLLQHLKCKKNILFLLIELYKINHK